VQRARRVGRRIPDEITADGTLAMRENKIIGLTPFNVGQYRPSRPAA
jgi:hypothetical protein